jgi:hypothetical protein
MLSSLSTERDVVCFVALLALAACARRPGHPVDSTTTITGAEIVPTDRAMRRVAAARCDREQACNDIGPGRDYGDYDSCLREIGGYARKTLGSERCAGRIVDSALSRCIQASRMQACGDAVDIANGPGSCQPLVVCR